MSCLVSLLRKLLLCKLLHCTLILGSRLMMLRMLVPSMFMVHLALHLATWHDPAWRAPAYVLLFSMFMSRTSCSDYLCLVTLYRFFVPFHTGTSHLSPRSAPKQLGRPKTRPGPAQQACPTPKYALIPLGLTRNTKESLCFPVSKRFGVKSFG